MIFSENANSLHIYASEKTPQLVVASFRRNLEHLLSCNEFTKFCTRIAMATVQETGVKSVPSDWQVHRLISVSTSPRSNLSILASSLINKLNQGSPLYRRAPSDMEQIKLSASRWIKLDSTNHVTALNEETDDTRPDGCYQTEPTRPIVQDKYETNTKHWFRQKLCPSRRS